MSADSQPIRYAWTATGMRPSETQFGPTRYVNEFEHERVVSEAHARGHAAGVAEERERAAKVCESMGDDKDGSAEGYEHGCASAIRAGDKGTK